MTKLNISILGTRGIPNNYGGYEQAASYLSKGLVERGHSVTVYNSRNHPYKKDKWNGVNIVHCYDPEYKIGTIGQFIYDRNCIMHARKHPPDVLLLLGYTSSSIWGKLYPRGSIIISNMDGLEWKRTKYSRLVRKYLKHAEKLAVKYSDYYIADSVVIRDYLANKYSVQSKYIPYGAIIRTDENEAILQDFDVTANNYCLLIARIEPENNIEMVIQGFMETNTNQKLLVVGNINNALGKRLTKEFIDQKQIQFTGSIFDQQKLHTLKFYCSLYFHGHSVGGTNPSLLEAMASRALIASHNNGFNKAILGDDAIYFSSAQDIKNILLGKYQINKDKMVCANISKIKEHYNWETITTQYEQFMQECFGAKR